MTTSDIVGIRRPLVLTGGPAVGKSVTGRILAQERSLCAFIDVDDVRQLVVAGAVAPWAGPAGQEQQRLGVRNASAISRNFLAAGIEVIIADVLTPETSRMYKQHLPDCLIIHLTTTLAEAQRRALTRTACLTDDEFRLLHEAINADPPHADQRIAVDALSVKSQAETVEARWSTSADGSVSSAEWGR